ncbi:hypothetical protein ACVRY7_10800 [Streptococcus ictaluri]|uniref:hypothetical protein n=1 Tax=Streptococcus ictaluri TaxID=380397 RepID=UPI000225D3BE|nr:hypothetical protein [Streptococcus ictaluri]
MRPKRYPYSGKKTIELITIGQDKKPTETVDFRISRLESVINGIEREIACVYGMIF